MKTKGILIISLIIGITSLISPTPLWAQNKTISGKVIDSMKEPLIGATIVIKGNKTVGTATNFDGEFTLNVPEKTSELEVTYIGFLPKVVSIKGINKITVTLEEDTKQLEEVEIVGYAKMRKSDVTGSVTSVSLNEVEAASTTSIQNLLQGRASGVQITTGDAAPGSAVNIKIRGTSSLTGNSEPLYIVDGIMMNSTSQDVSFGGVAGSNNFTQAQNGLTGINPQDIENIEILKDASATAIYGSLGANGVVLITTKSGKSDRTKVQYNGSVTTAHMVNKREMLNLEEYAQFMTEFKGNAYDLTNKVGIDWQDEISRNALSTNHRVSVSGKSDQTNYFISGGFLNNTGIIRNTDVKQADMRLNLDQKLTKFLRIGTKSSFTYSQNSMVQGSDTRGNSNSGLIRQAIVFPPFDPTGSSDEILDENGEVIKDPRAWFTDYKDISDEYRALTSVFADVSFDKYFSMRTTMGIDYRKKSRKAWFGTNLFQGAKEGGIVAIASMDALRMNIDHMFNYNRSFGKHRLDATAGFTITSSTGRNSTNTTSQFQKIMEGEDNGFMYGTKDDVMTYNRSTTNSVSALARVGYSYGNRYVLTSTFRTDGTSKFAPGNQFSYFPSFAFAYRMDQEEFMRNLGWISNLKIRLGWGQVGNQAINPYQTLMTFGNTQYARPDGGYDLAVFRNILPNKDLKWETTTTYNAGVDLGLWNNRLNLNLDVYQKVSTDLLQKINISSISGYSSMFVNRGSISNKGIEFAFDATVVQTKDFSFAVSGNISRNINKITDIGLPEGQFGAYSYKAMVGSNIGVGNYFKDYANIYIEGKPVALFFGTKVNGILQQTQVDADLALRDQILTDRGLALTNENRIALGGKDGLLPLYGGKLPTAGDPNYFDANDDGLIDSGDKTIIGDPNPDFAYGFTLDFKYKNFFLNAVFNGVYGNDIANANRLSEEDILTSSSNNITKHVYENYYRTDRPSTTYPRLSYNGSASEFTSFIVEDGSFLRLSALTFGYNWKLAKKKVISGIGVNVTARNLFVLTNYTGYDPEVSTWANDPLRVGIDWASYPNSRSFTLGVTLDF